MALRAVPVLPATAPSTPSEYSTYTLVYIPPNSTANFVCSAIAQNGNQTLMLRTGTQDTR